MRRFVRVKAKGHIKTGTLAAASYWVGLRQEIYVAIMNRNLPSIDMVDSLVDRAFTEADEQTWANRAVVHCVDVINICFGAPEVAFPTKWRDLSAWNEEWRRRLPLSCSAIYSEPWGGVSGTFPKIFYRSSCHSMSLIRPVTNLWNNEVTLLPDC